MNLAHPEFDSATVWVPGEHVDLEALKHQYDTVVFTVAAISVIESQMRRLMSALEDRPSGNEAESEADERLLDDARATITRLREHL